MGELIDIKHWKEKKGTVFSFENGRSITLSADIAEKIPKGASFAQVQMIADQVRKGEGDSIQYFLCPDGAILPIPGHLYFLLPVGASEEEALDLIAQDSAKKEEFLIPLQVLDGAVPDVGQLGMTLGEARERLCATFQHHIPGFVDFSQLPEEKRRGYQNPWLYYCENLPSPQVLSLIERQFIDSILNAF